MKPISKPKIDKSVIRVPEDVKDILRNGKMHTYDVMQVMANTVNNSANEVNNATDWVNENGTILVENEEERIEEFDKLTKEAEERVKKAVEQGASAQVIDGSISMQKLSTDVQSTIEDLIRKAYPMSVSIKMTPDELQEAGKSVPITLTWEAKISGTTVAPDGVSVNGQAVTGTQYTETVTTNKEFAVTVSAQGRSETVKKTVTFVNPIYTGYATEQSYADGLAQKLRKDLKTSIGMTVRATNDATNKYFWILTPYRMNKITTSGIDIMGDMVSGTATIEGASYYTYRLQKPSDIGTFEFVIS